MLFWMIVVPSVMAALAIVSAPYLLARRFDAAARKALPPRSARGLSPLRHAPAASTGPPGYG